jgi:hypothetical protein
MIILSDYRGKTSAEGPILSLVTTKFYFDLVRFGHKKAEYRDASREHNHHRFRIGMPHRVLMLHYRREEKMWLEIEMITLEPRSEAMRDVSHLSGSDFVFAVHVGNVIRYEGMKSK